MEDDHRTSLSLPVAALPFLRLNLSYASAPRQAQIGAAFNWAVKRSVEPLPCAHCHVNVKQTRGGAGGFESACCRLSDSLSFRLAAFRQDTKLTKLEWPNRSLSLVPPLLRSTLSLAPLFFFLLFFLLTHKQSPQSDYSNLLIPFWPYSALFSPCPPSSHRDYYHYYHYDMSVSL